MQACPRTILFSKAKKSIGGGGANSGVGDWDSAGRDPTRFYRTMGRGTSYY